MGKKKTNFIYHNENPDKLEINDCVCRAISFASSVPYDVIDDKLFYTSKLLDCEKLCVCCYSFLLEVYFGFQRVNGGGLTINDFCDIFNRGTYLVRVHEHISVVQNGKIYDIWDCGDEVITDSWFVKG